MVIVGCVTFTVTLESILVITGLSMEVVKITSNTKTLCKYALERFREPGGKIPKLHHGFNREAMGRVRKGLVKFLIQLVTYEGRYRKFYSHIFPMLNHFRRKGLSCFSFWIFFSLSLSIEKYKVKGSLPKYQGLLFRLYKFH